MACKKCISRFVEQLSPRHVFRGRHLFELTSQLFVHIHTQILNLWCFHFHVRCQTTRLPRMPSLNRRRDTPVVASEPTLIHWLVFTSLKREWPTFFIDNKMELNLARTIRLKTLMTDCKRLYFVIMFISGALLLRRFSLYYSMDK